MGRVNVYDPINHRFRSLGEQNKEAIMDYILKRTNQEQGTFARDIYKYKNLSRESVHNHLKDLLEEGRIYKSKRDGYFAVNLLLNDIFTFCKNLTSKFGFIFDHSTMVADEILAEKLNSIPRRQPLYRYPNFQIPDKIKFPLPFPQPSDYLAKSLTGTIMSDSFFRVNTKKQDEKKIYEFANRLGAYLVYVFIESLRPIKRELYGKSNSSRREVSLTIIFEAIEILGLFNEFKRFLTGSGIRKIKDSDDNSRIFDNTFKELFELDEESFNKLSTTFRSVYPFMYDGLENWWYNTRKLSMKSNRKRAKISRCSHSWKQYDLYKYGPCLKCKKCHLLIERKSSRIT